MHDFGGILGRPLDTFSFGLSQFHGRGSWLVCEVALIPTQQLFRHLYLTDMWLGVDLRTDTTKDTCLKGIGLHAQNMLTTHPVTILNSIVRTTLLLLLLFWGKTYTTT